MDVEDPMILLVMGSFCVQHDGDFEDLVIVFKFVDAVIIIRHMDHRRDADPFPVGFLGGEKGGTGFADTALETILDDHDQYGAAGHGKRQTDESLI